MIAALRSLLLFTVLLCGMHVAEPVQAHIGAEHFETAPVALASAAAIADRAFHADEPGAHQHDDAGDNGNAGHAAKHHCPFLSELPEGAVSGEPGLHRTPKFAAPQRALVSQDMPPPTQPPSA